MEDKRRQQKVRKKMFKCLRRILQIKNKIEDNQHRGQVKKMEKGRTYPTNGQEQQM